MPIVCNYKTPITRATWRPHTPSLAPQHMDKIEEQLLLKKYSKLLKLYFLSRTVFAKFSFKYRFVEYFFLKKKKIQERDLVMKYQFLIL